MEAAVPVQDLTPRPRHAGQAHMGWAPARSRMLLQEASLPVAHRQRESHSSR